MKDEKKTAELTEKELDQVSGGTLEGENESGLTRDELQQMPCGSSPNGGHILFSTGAAAQPTVVCTCCGRKWTEKSVSGAVYYVEA